MPAVQRWHTQQERFIQQIISSQKGLRHPSRETPRPGHSPLSLQAFATFSIAEATLSSLISLGLPSIILGCSCRLKVHQLPGTVAIAATFWFVLEERDKFGDLKIKLKISLSDGVIQEDPLFNSERSM